MNTIAEHVYNIIGITLKEMVVHKLATNVQNNIQVLYNKPFGIHKMWYMYADKKN